MAMNSRQSLVVGSIIIILLLLNIAYFNSQTTSCNSSSADVTLDNSIENEIIIHHPTVPPPALHPTDEARNKSLVVFSGLFTGKSDPQRVHIPQSYINCFGYFKDWYISLHNQSIEAIIFHDGISEDFIAKHTTDYVKFQLVPDEVLHSNLYPAEWRFLAYYDFIRNSPKKWDYIMTTDISDVIFNKNPLEFMLQHPEKDLFVSFEAQPGRSWVKDKWPLCFDNYDGFNGDFKIYAAGMWGGKWSAVYTHLHLLRNILLSIGNSKLSPGICDMLAQVRAVHDYWNGLPEIKLRLWDDGQPLFNKIRTNKGVPGEEPSVMDQYYVVHVHKRKSQCPDPPDEI